MIDWLMAAINAFDVKMKVKSEKWNYELEYEHSYNIFVMNDESSLLDMRRKHRQWFIIKQKPKFLIIIALKLF